MPSNKMMKVWFIEKVCCYNGVCYFKHWLETKGIDKDDMYNRAIETDTIEEYETEIEELEDEFVKWCDDKEVQAEDC